MRFGPFELDLHAATLRRAGLRVDVPPRPFALLCHLARHAGRVVSKDELLDAVWGRQFLTESALKATVNNLRRSLGEDGKAPRWIVSAPRRGYCLQLDPPPSAQDQPGTPLPEPVDPALIGRELELRQIVRLLAHSRLVTVLGSAGIGKTRLAVAALPALQSACADGAALVRLQGLRGESDLVAEIAQACALPEQAARSAAALAQGLSRRRQGLLLDNGEHLLAELAPLLERLLAQAPGLRVIATSQMAIGLPEEQLLRLRPLSLPPADGGALEAHAASALLLRRLRAARPGADFTPTQAALLAGICHALDGVPLQLELAAARVRLLGLEGVHAHLQDRLQMLRQETHGIDARHRSLRASIEWSHDLLDERQQGVLHRLSVFESSFATRRAQQLLAHTDALPAWEVVDIVEALAGRCLIAPADDDAAGDDAAGDAVAVSEPRWRLLQSLRLFAAERLAHAGETARTRDAHAQVMLAMLRQQMLDAHNVPIRDWAARFKPELADLRAALQHALASDPPTAWALWSLAVMVWLRNGLPHEATRGWQQLQQRGEPPDEPLVRADVALALALMCLYNLPVDLARGTAAADEAVQLNAALGRPAQQYHALYVQGQLYLRGRLPLHERGTLQAMAALERPDWPSMRLRYRRLLHGLALAQGGHAEAFRRCAEDELQQALALGNRDYVWTCQHSLGQAVFACGDVAGATSLFEQTWHEIENAGQAHLYWSTQALMTVLLAARDASSASSLTVARALRRLWLNQQLQLVCAAMPWLAWWRGRWQDAARLQGWARALLRLRGERAGPIPAWAEQSLRQRLQLDRTTAELDALAREGETLDEAQALFLAWPGAAPDGRDWPVGHPLGQGGALTP